LKHIFGEEFVTC